MSYSPRKTIKWWTYLKIRQAIINYITMTMTQMTSWWWRPSDSLTEGVPDTWNLPRRLVLNLLICSWGAAQNWQAAGTRQGSNGRSLHGVDEGQAVGQLKGHDLSINSAERRQKRVDISYNLSIHSGNVWNLFQGSSCAASVKDIKWDALFAHFSVA